jgi:hypothetical protein
LVTLPEGITVVDDTFVDGGAYCAVTMSCILHINANWKSAVYGDNLRGLEVDYAKSTDSGLLSLLDGDSPQAEN